jgi:hypothetical protein
MRQFGSTGFKLWNLGVEAKVLYSTFCALILCGIVSSALYYGDLVGGGLQGVRRYYAGDADGSVPGSAGAVDGKRGGAQPGPQIEVPDDADTQQHQPIVVAVTYRKLLEVTHFHLFTMPVVLLIVGHLFFATGLGQPAKLGWVSAAATTLTLHFATPWLVHFGTPRLAFLHAVSGAAMTLSMGVLTVYPVLAMWRKPPVKPPAAA